MSFSFVYKILAKDFKFCYWITTTTFYLKAVNVWQIIFLQHTKYKHECSRLRLHKLCIFMHALLFIFAFLPFHLVAKDTSKSISTSPFSETGDNYTSISSLFFRKLIIALKKSFMNHLNGNASFAWVICAMHWLKKHTAYTYT